MGEGAKHAQIEPIPDEQDFNSLPMSIKDSHFDAKAFPHEQQGDFPLLPDREFVSAETKLVLRFVQSVTSLGTLRAYWSGEVFDGMSLDSFFLTGGYVPADLDPRHPHPHPRLLFALNGWYENTETFNKFLISVNGHALYTAGDPNSLKELWVSRIYSKDSRDGAQPSCGGFANLKFESSAS